MTTALKKNDPAQAREFFAKKMAFTTGPVELNAQIESHADLVIVDVRASEDFDKSHNLMHNLKAERFFKPRLINGAMAGAEGPIKTFPLRGIKDSPPYLHDGRLLTLEDTVEFFNLILETKLTAPEKTDLVAFLRTL